MYYDIIILVLIWVIVFKLLRTEKFQDLVFNNSTRSTRNMSYDLRCDAGIQPGNQIWLNPTIIPAEKIKCLELN